MKNFDRRFFQILHLLALLSLCLLPEPSHALRRGGNSSGGGNAEVFDDRVVLAHPYRMVGKQVKFSNELIIELERAGKILVRYGADFTDDDGERSIGLEGRPRGPMDQSAFVQKYVKNWGEFDGNSPIEYRFVKEVPNLTECENNGHFLPGHKNGKTVRLACTNGDITWIQEDLFKKMSIREQAKTIIHERLHAYNKSNLNPVLFHEFVDDITEGLDVALSLYFQQDYWMLASQGLNHSPLKKEQVDQLRLLMRRIANLSLNASRIDAQDSKDSKSFLKRFAVTPNGGGLIEQQKDMRLPENGFFVGIAAIAPSQLTNHTVLADVSCYDPRTQKVVCQIIDDNVTMLFVNLFADQPDEGYRVLLHNFSRLYNADIRLFKSTTRSSPTRLSLDYLAHLDDVTIVNLHRVVLKTESGVDSIKIEGRSETGTLPSLYLTEESRLRGPKILSSSERDFHHNYKLTIISENREDDSTPILEIKGSHFRLPQFDFSSPFCGPGRPAQLILRQRLSTITNPQKDAPTFCR